MSADLSALAAVLGDRLVTDEAVREEHASDFGRIVHNPPAAVARPISTDEVAALVKAARGGGIALVSRGQAHNQSGLSTIAAGVVLDLSGLDTVGEPDAGNLLVEAGGGVIWRDLVMKTLPAGLAPPVLTNNLGVSVGGTLSMAGLGIASFRHGCQGDQVERLEVVTGAGDVVLCSRDENADLFDAVRSGLGLCGVITRAWIRLEVLKPMIRTHYLLYDELSSLMQDAQALMTDGRFEHLESWCVPAPQGFRKVDGVPTPFAQWFFPLHASVGFTPGEEPDDTALLAGLHHYRSVHVEDRTTAEFFLRLEPLFELWKRGGYWGNAHPWMETILPWEATGAYITGVLDKLPPHVLGGGHILLWPSRGDTSEVPLFMRPQGEFVMGFGILPGLPPAALPMANAMLGQAGALSLKMGAKRYLSGWHDADADSWKAHYGGMWPRPVAWKQQFDPDGVLNPGLLPLDA